MKRFLVTIILASALTAIGAGRAGAQSGFSGILGTITQGTVSSFGTTFGFTAGSGLPFTIGGNETVSLVCPPRAARSLRPMCCPFLEP